MSRFKPYDVIYVKNFMINETMHPVVSGRFLREIHTGMFKGQYQVEINSTKTTVPKEKVLTAEQYSALMDKERNDKKNRGEI